MVSLQQRRLLLIYIGFWLRLSVLCRQSQAFIPLVNRGKYLDYSFGTGVPIHSTHDHSYLSKRFSPLSAKPREKDREASSKELVPTIDLEKGSTLSPPLFYKPTETNSISKRESEFELNSVSFRDYLPMLILLWFIALLSSLDRVAMSVAILPLSQEYHLTDSLKGQIASLFSVGYGLGIIPAGLFAAVASPRLLMAFGISLWSIATLLTPVAAFFITSQPLSMNDSIITTTAIVASSIFPLLAVRAIMGSAESVVLPTTQKLLANWIPADKKSGAIAVIFSGFQMGTVGAYLISPFIMDWAGGWRGLFEIYGLIGLGILIPWMVFAKDGPDSVSSMSLAGYNDLDGKKADAWEEATATWKTAPWADFIKSPAVCAMTIAHAANNWGLYNSLSWTPTFYAEQYHLDVKDSAFLSILPSVAGAAGGLLAGWASEKILAYLSERADGLDEDECKEVERITLVRKAFQGVALLGPAACLLTLSSHIPDQPQVAQALLTGTVGLQAFNSAGYSAATQEKAGTRWSGLLYSVTSLPGVILGSFGVYVTGQILESTDQNWSEVFALNGGIDVIGALAFLILYNAKQEFE